MGKIINIHNQRALEVMKGLGYRIMPPMKEEPDLKRGEPIASVEIPDRVIGPQYGKKSKA